MCTCLLGGASTHPVGGTSGKTAFRPSRFCPALPNLPTWGRLSHHIIPGSVNENSYIGIVVSMNLLDVSRPMALDGM
jgi:hypothetical protein